MLPTWLRKPEDGVDAMGEVAKMRCQYFFELTVMAAAASK